MKCKFTQMAITGLVLNLAVGSIALADDIDVHLTVPKNLVFLADGTKKFDESLRAISGGKMGLKIYGAGELVPAKEVLESVSTGAVPAGWSFLGQWGGKVPVAQIGATPFGADPGLLSAWLYEGGGLEIIQRGFTPLDIKLLACHITNPEPGGWFNKEINSVKDFQGLKMRMSGVGAKVLNELGASAQYLPGGEIYLALERGRIDATEYSLPIIDKQLGFNKIAKYYYYPGWHQPGSVDVLMINMAVWNDFDKQQKAMMESACKDSLLWTLNFAPAAQTPVIEAFEGSGTVVKRFPDKILAKLREVTEKVLDGEAAKDPLYNEAYRSMKAFVKSAGRWNALQNIPN